MSLSFSFNKTPFLFSIFHKNHLINKPTLNHSKTLIIIMSLKPKPFSSKRATCNTCSKPSQLCLCNRFKNLKLDNSIALTILQHSLEKDHPLNSTRIAFLGLKNVEILRVLDVHCSARFSVWPICEDFKVGIELFDEKSKDILEFEESNLENKRNSFRCNEVLDSEKLYSGLEKLDIRSIISDSEMGIDDCFDERNNESKDTLEFEKLNLEIKMNSIRCNEVSGFAKLESDEVADFEKLDPGLEKLDIRSIISVSEVGIGCFEERNKELKVTSKFKELDSGLKKNSIPSIISDSEVGIDCFNERNKELKEISNFEKLDSGLQEYRFRSMKSDSEMGIDCFDERNNGSKEKLAALVGNIECKEKLYLEKFPITFSISKHGVTSTDFELLFGSAKVRNALLKGFVVKKWQHKFVNGKTTDEELEEFEIVVPPGSALLFPSENSVGIEAIDFEVRNLIVLDGTWNKAKRIYSENPWLKVLPHLKLDVDKMSLYSEVRRQPRAGYLSTIESIVYAMTGLGDKTDGLYNLLEVFESMVVDQRRCKDERLSNISVQ